VEVIALDQEIHRFGAYFPGRVWDKLARTWQAFGGGSRCDIGSWVSPSG
jgi:hypothetical protein